MIMEHIYNTFSYSKDNNRHWIERKLDSTYYIVIKRIDNENAELYFRNSTTSYCELPMDVFVIDIVTNISIPRFSNNSYLFSNNQHYKVTIGTECIFSLHGYSQWIVDKEFYTVCG